MCLEMALLDSIDLETWSIILVDPVSGWVATEASSLESDLFCEISLLPSQLKEELAMPPIPTQAGILLPLLLRKQA